MFRILTSRLLLPGTIQGLSVRHYSAAISDATPEELKAVRSWLSKVKRDDIIPSRLCEVSFSRSSGPGGQNVNKVSSKATVRVPLEELLQRVPTLLHEGLYASRFYAAKSNSLVIQADDSRKQSDNQAICFRRLYDEIVEAAANVIPGETSEPQKNKVLKLQKRDNQNRLNEKKHHSKKKASRKGGFD